MAHARIAPASALNNRQRRERDVANTNLIDDHSQGETIRLLRRTRIRVFQPAGVKKLGTHPWKASARGKRRKGDGRVCAFASPRSGFRHSREGKTCNTCPKVPDVYVRLEIWKLSEVVRRN